MSDLRASGLPLYLKCGQSSSEEATHIDDAGEPAEIGTAVHEALAVMVTWPEHEWREFKGDAMQRIWERHGADPDECDMLVHRSEFFWRQIQQKFLMRIGNANVDVEAELALDYHLDNGQRVTNTIDALMFPTEDVAVVVDWKTGRLEGDYIDQAYSYAYAVLTHHADLRRVVYILAYVRRGYYISDSLSPEDLRRWAEATMTRARNNGDRYHPGEHCFHCSRCHDCEARTALVRQTIRDLEEQEGSIEATFEELDDPERAEALGPQLWQMYNKASKVKKLAETFMDIYKSAVKKHDGIPISDLEIVRMKESSRQPIDTLRAMPVLREMFTIEEMAEFITVPKGRMLAAVGAKTPRYDRPQQAKQRFLERLREADAFGDPVTYYSLEREYREDGTGSRRRLSADRGSGSGEEVIGDAPGDGAADQLAG